MNKILEKRFLSTRYLGLGVILAFIAIGTIAVIQHTEKSTVEDLRFEEMYSGASSLGIELSDKLKRLVGKRVKMTGFMAPPLKPTLSFFVLTAIPLSICPFCSSDADWPADIVVVKLREPVTALPFDSPINIEGILEIGSEVDNETGFVSLVRIKADRLRDATSSTVTEGKNDDQDN